MQAAELGRKIGWWGTMVVQVKIDSRDGVPKLMEINPRMGNGLWWRVAVGMNEPLMCIKIAKGEEVEAVKDYPAGTILIHPVEDVLGLGIKLVDLLVYKFRVNLRGRKPIDPLNHPPSVEELMRSYKKTYFNRKKKVYDFYFSRLFQRPSGLHHLVASDAAIPVESHEGAWQNNVPEAVHFRTLKSTSRCSFPPDGPFLRSLVIDRLNSAKPSQERRQALGKGTMRSEA